MAMQRYSHACAAGVMTVLLASLAVAEGSLLTISASDSHQLRKLSSGPSVKSPSPPPPSLLPHLVGGTGAGSVTTAVASVSTLNNICTVPVHITLTPWYLQTRLLHHYPICKKHIFSTHVPDWHFAGFTTFRRHFISRFIL